MIFLLEIIAVFLVIMFIITQLLIPSIRGTALFPYFKKTKQIEDEIRETQNEIYNQALKEDLEELKQSINNRNNLKD